MNFLNRLKNGWEFAKISFRVLNDNRELLLFPIISSVSLIVILLTFFGSGFYLFGEQIEAAFSSGIEFVAYGLVFLYYLINYFIVVFFNSALVHCAIKLFNNEKTSMRDGLEYAASKTGKIFGWAALSATVGMILQMIQNAGKVGEFISALLGTAWTILTFFAVPILIYEERSVLDTVKESGRIIKDKWGESLGGSFSFGLIHFVGMLLAVGIVMAFNAIAVPFVGLIIGGIAALLTFTITSAASTVFKAAIYNHVNDRPTGYFESEALDNIFMPKR